MCIPGENTLRLFVESQLFAAIVGAVIGLLPAHLLMALHEKRKERQQHTSWLHGLLAEIAHIDGCINEISTITASGKPSTKRLNSDFFAQSRLVLFAYDKDVVFLQSLTNAFRDIVHTNDMLDRFERMAPNHLSFAPNTQASLSGVHNSILSLKQIIEKKLKGS